MGGGDSGEEVSFSVNIWRVEFDMDREEGGGRKRKIGREKNRGRTKGEGWESEND